MNISLKISIIGVCLLLNKVCYGQDLPAFTDEVVLWNCPNDTSAKITYRYSNYSNIIEINGPIVMDTASVISGILKLSEGSFEENKLTPQQQAEHILNKKITNIQNVQQKTITIKSGFFSAQIYYYNTNIKPSITFEGDCMNAKTKQLNKDLQLPPKRKKELQEQFEKDKGKFKPKTKTVVIGNRG